MATPHQAANGHRRRELVKRVMAEETHCALCHEPVDKTLTNLPEGHSKKCPTRQQTPGGVTTTPCPGCQPHPMRAEIDEDLPRSRGGSPTDRANTHLMHRKCNQWKNTMTLAEAHQKLAGTAPPAEQRPPVTASPIW